jgi:hypothetical protein|tara:strand:+ start:212 stop:862 length:651 start_codon:yes stop_codon:yes gene_type:complete
MANSNGSFGLRPIGIVGQGANTTGATEYRIASNNNTKLYQGSPVIPIAGGTISEAQAAAGGNVAFLGVFWGCEYVRASDGKTIWSATWQGTAAGADANYPIKAFVYDNPMQTFTIATSNVVGAANTEAEVRAMVFKNIALATATAGSDVTGISSASADLNTAANTATLQLRVIGVQDDPDNSDFTVAGIPLIVRLNTSFNSANGGIAAGTPSSLGV